MPMNLWHSTIPVLGVQLTVFGRANPDQVSTTDHFPPPSNMAQSIHETAPGTSEIHSPGYARHTISSSQRQRKPQMSDRKRSASKNSANTGFPNLHVEHVAREGFMPNSSVRSNTRAETSSLQAGYTPARVSRPSPQPTSTSSQLPNSPPPKYMERSELPIQSHTTNFPPSPVLSLSPPPLYHERTPEQERGILTCSHADEDSRESETVPPSLGVLAKSFFNSSIAGSLTDYNASYQANRPATPTFLPMCCANRRKAYADSTIASRQRQRGRQISSPNRSQT
ncbi:hypothetical protein RSAG8_10992, partial [Rhizoctonia solani AG-8 WAC10335]